MSCMEHSCIECGHMVMNNDRGPSFCPKCMGDMAHYFDEQADYDRERTRRDREEDGE